MAYLKLTDDCIILHNREDFGLATRNREYTAYSSSGAIATITERVLDPSGGITTAIGNPTSSSTTGIFNDQVGAGPFQGGGTLYQYFVTSLPGTPWTNVPTYVQTNSGDYMVFKITLSKKTFNGIIVNDVSYNGDAGMWNADGTPRLPLCTKQ